MSDDRLRTLERAVQADPSDLGALRLWADERRRQGEELLPATLPSKYLWTGDDWNYFFEVCREIRVITL